MNQCQLPVVYKASDKFPTITSLYHCLGNDSDAAQSASVAELLHQTILRVKRFRVNENRAVQNTKTADILLTL